MTGAEPVSRPVRVAVTGGGALLGQGIIRALKRGSLPTWTIVVDVNPLSAGLYWGDEAHLVPPAASAGYVPAIRRLLEATRPDILLVGTDVELIPLAAARDELERDFDTKILVSSPAVVAIADDKFETSRFFRAHGIASTASALATDEAGIRSIVETFGFPIVVKPRVGARSYGFSLSRNHDELTRAIQSTANAVIQECVGNDQHEYTASGLYFDGRCDAVIVMRRDLRDGNTYRAFTVNDAALEAQVRRWTETLRPYGPANFQFRIDRSGVPKVFEINARFSGTTPLRARAGFDEVDMCIRKVVRGEPIAQPDIRPLTILRHWSETVVEPDRTGAVTAI